MPLLVTTVLSTADFVIIALIIIAVGVAVGFMPHKH